MSDSDTYRAVRERRALLHVEPSQLTQHMAKQQGSDDDVELTSDTVIDGTEPRECLTLPDGSCIAPWQCMHGPAMTYRELSELVELMAAIIGRSDDARVEFGADALNDTSKANARQVGGSHYGGGTLQHWDLVHTFGLGYFDGNATKYLFRWRRKGGVEDLRKAQHYIEKLIELETQQS